MSRDSQRASLRLGPVQTVHFQVSLGRTPLSPFLPVACSVVITDDDTSCESLVVTDRAAQAFVTRLEPDLRILA